MTVGTARGLEVRSSAVLVPEHPQAGFAYSLRIKMDPSVMREERGFDRCQLHMRHWEITDEASSDVKRVDGEGVVGKMPVSRVWGGNL